MTFLSKSELSEIFLNSKLSNNEYYTYIRPSCGHPFFVVAFQFHDRLDKYKFRSLGDGSIIHDVSNIIYKTLDDFLTEVKSKLRVTNFLEKNVSIPTFAFDLIHTANALNPDKNHQIFFAAADSEERTLLVYEDKDYQKPHLFRFMPLKERECFVNLLDWFYTLSAYALLTHQYVNEFKNKNTFILYEKYKGTYKLISLQEIANIFMPQKLIYVNADKQYIEKIWNPPAEILKELCQLLIWTEIPENIDYTKFLHSTYQSAQSNNNNNDEEMDDLSNQMSVFSVTSN